MNTVNYFTDLDLNLLPHPLTGDIVSLKNNDAIKQALRILFFLNKYDIPFEPESVEIEKYLFQPVHDITITNIRKRMEWMIRVHEPRIDVIDIVIEPFVNLDGYEITVTYKIKQNNAVETFTEYFRKFR